MIGSIKKLNRSGKQIYVCPLCGHIFPNNKKYTKHLNKSHIRKISKDKRKRKKFIKSLLIVKIKEENGIELTKKDKIINLKARLNNIKL